MKHDPNGSMALAATLHCLTGCSIGEVAGMLIASGTGIGNVATIGISLALAFVFGYALSSLPLLAGGLPVRRVAGLVLAADTLSILTMEIVDNGFVALVPGALDAGLGDPLFWWSTLVSLLVAFAAAYPVNRWLFARGRGHAITHGAEAPAGANRRAVPVPPTAVLAVGIATFMIGGLLAAAA